MSTDRRILQYYLERLNEEQKVALLSVAKAFVDGAAVVSEEKTPELSGDIDLQRRALIQAEREHYLQGAGVSYTPEQVRLLALDKDRKRVV